MAINYFLIVGVIILSGCSPDVLPTKYVYNLDLNKQVCDRYVVSDYEKIKFKFEKAIPISECQSTFGFSSDDTGKVMSYIRKIKKELDECQ